MHAYIYIYTIKYIYICNYLYNIHPGTGFFSSVIRMVGSLGMWHTTGFSQVPFVAERPFRTRWVCLSWFILISGCHPLTNTGWWYTYPSEKWWSSSVGMMKFPTEWKNKIHVPNHQLPGIFLGDCYPQRPKRQDLLRVVPRDRDRDVGIHRGGHIA